MKIFIIGKVGELEQECKARFETAEGKLRRLGLHPVNPLKIGIPWSYSGEESFRITGRVIREYCHGVFVLADWRESTQAREEIKVALRHQKELYYEEDEGYEDLEAFINAGVIKPTIPLPTPQYYKPMELYKNIYP